jgi:hypothetical protein
MANAARGTATTTRPPIKIAALTGHLLAESHATAWADSPDSSPGEPG